MYDEKDLGRDIKNNKDEIVVEGDLARRVIKIKITGNVAWGVCIAAIAIAIVGIPAAAPTGGASAIITAPAMIGTVGILGAGTATSAVAIAIAAGGVGALNKLRNYKMEKISDTKIILRRK